MLSSRIGRRFLLCWIVSYPLWAEVVTEDATIQGRFLEFTVQADAGAPVTHLGWTGRDTEYVGGDGCFQEGFGVPNDYVPNRRLNEYAETTSGTTPTLVYRYEGDGPNIRGLRIARTLMFNPEETVIRVDWQVENAGDEAQWVTPWLRHDIEPGGKVGKEDLLEAPTTEGLIVPQEPRFYPAARNWVAATDPVSKDTIFAVFDAEQLHSFLLVPSSGDAPFGVQAWYVPRYQAPKTSWHTTTFLGMVRGLSHVNFASEELLVQLDYQGNVLTAIFASTKTLNDVQIKARILGPNQRVWKLPLKKFSISPSQIVRATYEWQAPGEGAYDYLAEVSVGGKVYPLGADTHSPHGGIDARFLVGKSTQPRYEPWTEATTALDRQPRRLVRTPLAITPAVQLWTESSLAKVFLDDRWEANGPPTLKAELRAARGEAESFQIVVQAKDVPLHNVRLTVHDFVHEQNAARIPPDNVKIYRVGYIPVYVPSHFEGPTGLFPDPLFPTDKVNIAPNALQPFWVTVQVPRRIPAGKYRAAAELTAQDTDAVEFTVELEVYDFSLPLTPTMKTDFRFSPRHAMEGAKARGGNPSPERLGKAYLDEALSHRITLRDLVHFPEPGAESYDSRLREYEPFLKEVWQRGASCFALPPALLDTPPAAQAAEAFAARLGLTQRVFVQVADEPEPPAWPKVAEALSRWKQLAPSIPTLVSTYGLAPYLPDQASIWLVHLPLMDTVNNQVVLDRIAQGQEVWCYVNDAPARPYANFFVDFAGIEHRIFFWQAWLLGMKGIHYWSVNYLDPKRDFVRQGIHDAVPTNGDGILLYPGTEGPIPSVRLEILRDGLEDCDYLSLLREYVKRYTRERGTDDLTRQAEAALNLSPLVPNLVSFTRKDEEILRKREEIARAVERLRKALGIPD